MSNPDPSSSPVPAHRRWNARRTMASVGLVVASVAGGAVLASTVSAGAATTSSTTPPANTGTGGPTAGAAPSGAPPAYHVPDMSGTVTAVGTTSVTIKISSATTTYAVTSSSDIDKNGEATLSALAPGDAVTFNLANSAATPTIDKLHAGNEALDRPSGPPPGPGGPGAGQPGGSSSAGSTAG